MTDPAADTPPPTDAPDDPVAPVAPTPVGLDTPATLPTARLLGSIAVPGLAIAAAWGLAALALGRRGTDALIGPLGALAATTVIAATVVGLQPWRPRRLATWPMLWTGLGFLDVVVVLGVGALLYSRPQFRGVELWLAITVAYLVILASKTRVYAGAMHRFSPERPGSNPLARRTSE